MAKSTPTALNAAARLSVAPMMAWTDRHCRYFHRLMSAKTLLYTEMVTAAALVYGDAPRFLRCNVAEHPVALQVGGSDPELLGRAAGLAVNAGYKEINLNLGCPSERVKSGTFGAVLMQEPERVARCVNAMQKAAPLGQITVKCRIGVDDQNPQQVLPKFIKTLRQEGIKRIIIHARKAWLSGLSPKENRDVPPLDYPLVHKMKQSFADMHISVNGGITSLEAAQTQLRAGMDGVMIGRAAYHTPYDILAPADHDIFGVKACALPTRLSIAHQMAAYIEAHIRAGGRMHQVTRHMLGLFAAQAGARHWRQSLSNLGADASAGRAEYEALLDEMAQIQAGAAQKVQEPA